MICLMIICCPAMLCAQGHLFKSTVGNVFKKETPSYITQSALEESLQRSFVRANASLLLTHDVASSSRKTLREESGKLFLSDEKIDKYYQAIAEFKKFKKESAPFFYYQFKPLERRVLSTQEVKYWMDRMMPVNEKLRQLTGVFSAKDPALLYAQEFMTQAMRVVHPSSVPLLESQFIVSRANERVYEDETFFFCEEKPFDLEKATLLTKDKTIVFVNDDGYFLAWLDSNAEKKILFPQSKVRTFGSMVQFLLAIQTQRVKPDLVFTDLVLADGSGECIANELRRWGFEGGIIGLTSYAPSTSLGKKMLANGFDGMVSTHITQSGQLEDRIMHAAQLYLSR